MTLYCSLDLETTGINALHTNILEIGAVIDSTDGKQYEGTIRPEFHCYVVQDLYTCDPYAASMHPEIFKRIAEREKPFYYYSPNEAVFQLSLWLSVSWPKDQPVFFAGKNFAQFDLPFLRRLPGFEETISFHPSVLDPGPLFLDPLIDSKNPNLSVCCERAGLENHVTHTALEDALQVSSLIQAYYAKRSQRGWIWPKSKRKGGAER